MLAGTAVGARTSAGVEQGGQCVVAVLLGPKQALGRGGASPGGVAAGPRCASRSTGDVPRAARCRHCGLVRVASPARVRAPVASAPASFEAWGADLRNLQRHGVGGQAARTAVV